MKKTLLSSVFTLIACLCVGQGTYYHPEFYFDKMSPNGRWLSTHAMGTIYLYSRADSLYDEYAASEDAVTEYYATGVGNCWSNTGVLVGGVSDRECAYWQNYEWNELPVKAENQGLNVANGITPDGSRIVGNVGISAMNMYSEQMVKPVYWDRNAGGSYDLYKELPYPATDFSGRVPQYVTAIAISDDGKTVIGQVVDWSGFYIYPIVYTQADNGEWSYRTYSEGILYPEGATFGVWPGEEPARPNGELYMNDEELAAYRAALNEYLIAYEKYMMEQITWEELPEEPDPADYIIERIDEYNSVMNQYQKDLSAYYQKVYEFDVIMQNNMYGYCFTINNAYLSGNGRYYSTTMKHTDVSNPLSPKTISTPVRFDLNESGNVMTMVATNIDMIASSVMNDGCMIVQNPAMAYGRNSFVTSTDCQTLTTFVDYINGRNSDVANWVKAMTTFDVLVADSYDEYGNPNISVVEDSIVAGSVHCNSEGTIFTSFMYDEWSDGDVIRQFSYQIDFTEDAAVDGVNTDKSSMAAYITEGNTLQLQGNVEQLAIYDLRGGLVMQAVNPQEVVTLDAPQGVYIVKLSNNTDVYTTKVVVK